MGDCPNVEMRELLPERVAELLSPRDAERVDAHVAECEMCAFELSVLRAARAVMHGRAAVDVSRISAAVVSATRTPVRGVRQRQTRQWVGWRAAASIALLAVGATSIAVWNGVHDDGRRGVTAPRATETAAVATPSGAPTLPQSVAAANGSRAASEPAVQVQGSAQRPGAAVAVSAGLTAAGGLSDLNEAELGTLLDDIGSLDASSVDEPQEVLPAIGGSEGVQ